MFELIKTVLLLPFPANMIIVLGSLGICVPIVAAIAIETRKYATRRAELDLKRDMIERGMSPDEIERVLGAGTTSEDAA